MKSSNTTGRVTGLHLNEAAASLGIELQLCPWLASRDPSITQIPFAIVGVRPEIH